MNRTLKLILILITIIIFIFIGAFKVFFINGRFYIESRWIGNYEFSSKKAHEYNTIIIVDSNCSKSGTIKINGYIDDEEVFSNDFIVGGEKNTDIKVYRNLKSGEHILAIKTEKGLETHKKIQISKGQKWVYVTYEEDENSNAKMNINMVERSVVIYK